MKKNILSDIDKVIEERKLSKEMEKKIFIKAILNWGIGVSIIILIMLLNFTKFFFTKEATIDIYNICAIFFLAFSIISIETGYKKDSGERAATSIEIMIFAIFVLFAPQIFIPNNYTIMHSFIALITIYYSCKIIGIYCIDKKKYLTEISDITDIIKKESKDELVEQEKEKRKEEIRNLLEEQNNNKKVIKKSKKTKKTKTDTDINETTSNTETIASNKEKEVIKPKNRKPRTTAKKTDKILQETEKTATTLPEKTIVEEVKTEEKPKAKRTRTTKKSTETAEKVETKPEEKAEVKKTRTTTQKEAEGTETKVKKTRTTKKSTETAEKVETKTEEKSVDKKPKMTTKKNSGEAETTTRKPRTTTKKKTISKENK